jgi:hypothetical protein
MDFDPSVSTLFVWVFFSRFIQSWHPPIKYQNKTFQLTTKLAALALASMQNHQIQMKKIDTWKALYILSEKKFEKINIYIVKL